MDNWLVYKHTSPSGKVYIGITSRSANERWGKNGSRYRNNTTIGIAIKKYGWDNFKHEVLFENINEISAKLIEIDLIYYYKKQGISYNITDGGDGQLGRDSVKVDQYDLDGNFIQTFSSFTSAFKSLQIPSNQISRWCKSNKPHNGYYWRKHGDPLNIYPEYTITQYTMNGEFVANYTSQREAALHNNITYKALNVALKAKGQCGKFLWTYYGEPLIINNNLNKPVTQYKNGIAIGEYYCIAEAARITNIKSPGNIAECCKGNRKSAGGFQWKFKTDICISD